LRHEQRDNERGQPLRINGGIFPGPKKMLDVGGAGKDTLLGRYT
jgi:hypothetical protein